MGRDLLLGLLGYVINLILVLIEKRVLAWHRGFRGSVLGVAASTKAPRSRRVAAAR